jgi:hypothetical protein
MKTSEKIQTVENLKNNGIKVFAYVSNDGLNYSENSFKTETDALEHLITRADLDDYRDEILSGEKSIHDFGDFFNMIDVDEYLNDLKKELF